MPKSSTQSQSSNDKSGPTKKIVKNAKKANGKKYDKQTELRIKKIAASQLKEKCSAFFDKVKRITLKGGIGKHEQKCREDLALCYRVAHYENLNEGVDNHFSLMLEVEGHNCLLTLPHGILWNTAKPEDFILVDMDGNILRPSGRKDDLILGHTYLPDISAVKIHGKIHEGVGPDRACAVFHTHQPFTTVLSACNAPYDELRQIHQTCSRFYDSTVNNREFNGIVNNDEEGKNLAKMFKKKGNEHKRVMLMRNHGIITIGPTAAQAMMDLYFYERSARMNVEMLQTGVNLDDCCIDDEIAKGVWEYTNSREIDRFSINLLSAWRNAGI